MKKTPWIVTPSPFILVRNTVDNMNLTTLLCLLPHVMMILIDRDFAALLIAAVSVAASLLSEVFLSFTVRRKVYDPLAVLLAGLLSGLLLPSVMPPLIAFGSVFIGMCISRVLFGGNGSYWMHPVAVAIGIAWISRPDVFPGQLVSIEGVRGVGSFFEALKLDNFAVLPQDAIITSQLNTGFLSHLGIKLPEGYITLFWNSPSTIPAFRYNAFTLISSIFLIAMRNIDAIVPSVFILTYAAAVRVLSLVPITAAFMGGDILFSLLTGGILFIAFFLAGDYSVNPRTLQAKIVMGIISGAIAFLVCGPGGTPVGGIFTLLAMNSIAPFIEKIESRRFVDRSKTR
ncbi:MAG: RnfABCDGE type electron transport complex subunit D [Spirochaetales bacterium]|nr:RnfABCDGE type electron transport complex subunit D [Spirochaetales bacterium]